MSAAGGERRVHVIQGEYAVAGDGRIVLSTVLGSCVAACIIDPVARIGGMNHFLLPGDDSMSSGRDRESLGAHLMEVLVNGLMKAGAQRDRLQAKLFGGARVVRGLSDIGRKNSEFAERYLTHEGIEVIGKDVGGARGRRLRFWPATGRARVSYIADDSGKTVFAAEDLRPAFVARDVELFN